MKESFEKFKELRVAVVGDIIYDRFIWGEAKRISPEAPVPVVDVLKIEENLGGAGNVPNNILALGAGCDLYGVLGADYHGKLIEKMCKEKRVGLKFFYDEWPTIVKERLMAYSSSDRTRAQQLARIDRGEFYLENGIKKRIPKIRKELEDNLLNILGENMEKYDYILLSDYDKRIFTKNSARGIIQLAKSKGKPVLTDPKPENAEFFYGSDVICPNREEAEKISGIKLDGNLVELCKKLSEKINSKYVVVTLDKDGACSYYEGHFHTVPTIVVETADVAGAGDTFAATLALGLAAGEEVHNSVKLANAASGVVVEKRGVQTASPQEIIKYFARYGQKLS